MNRFDEDAEDHQNIEIGDYSDQKSFQSYDEADQNPSLVHENKIQELNNIIHLNEQNNKNKIQQKSQQQDPCLEKCIYSSINLQKFIDEGLKDKYEKYFFFYFAKPINEILSNSPVHHVVLFKEYLFIDDNTEYAKRFYLEHETKQRIEQLAGFYKKVYPPNRPNHFSNYQIFNEIIQLNKQNQEKLYYKQAQNNEKSSFFFNHNNQDDLNQGKVNSISCHQLEIESDSHFKDSQLMKENDNQLSQSNLNSVQLEMYSNNNNNDIQNDKEQNNVQSQIKTNQQQFNFIRNLQHINEQQDTQNSQKHPFSFQKQQNEGFSDINDLSSHMKLSQLEDEDAKIDNQAQDKNQLKNLKEVEMHKDILQQKPFIESECLKNLVSKESLTNKKKQKQQECEQLEKQQLDQNIGNKNRRGNKNEFQNNENKQKPHQQQNQKVEEEKDNKQFDNNDNQFEEQDDFEDMLNILHNQNQQKFQNQQVNIHKLEFEDQNDFSLQSDEFMDQDNFAFANQKNNFYCDSQKVLTSNSQKYQRNLQNDPEFFTKDYNYEHELRNEFYQDFKQDYQSSSQTDNKIENYNEERNSYDQTSEDNDSQINHHVFGDNSFMKELNEYEMGRSFETDTFDVYNPQFSSENLKSPKYILEQVEQKLYNEVCDFQDIDDLMERYAIGEETEQFICRCAELDYNIQNNSNKLFEQQQKDYFQRMENNKDQRNILRRQSNSQRSKNNDNSKSNLQQFASSIESGQIKKAASTSLSKLKNHSSTPSNQNNNPSSSSIKSSHPHQTLQPEDYQFQTLQQSLQQQIQQQQTFNQQNSGHQILKSPVKKSENFEQNKLMTDNSPNNKEYEKEDFIDLSPIFAQKNQNFNEMLQAQIQNQMIIKQKLEKQKGENSNVNKFIEQNQQYFSNYDAKGGDTGKNNQQFQQSQSQMLLINQLQQSQSNKSVQNPNVSLTNSKHTNNNNISSSNNNNSKIDQSPQIYQQNMQQQSKPIYSNSQKKLVSQLVFQNNLLYQQSQSIYQQQKAFKQNEFSLNNQQQNSSLYQAVACYNNQGQDSSSSVVTNLIKQGQAYQENGNSKKKFKKQVQNEIQNQSSQNNIQQNAKPKVNQNNQGNQHQNNFHQSPLSSIHQMPISLNNQQQASNSSKNNQHNKSNNFSQQNLKNNLSKGLNSSPQSQLNMLSQNQQNFNEKSQPYKAYNQISSQYSNNQSKQDLKNTTSSLIASTSSSQKALKQYYIYSQIEKQFFSSNQQYQNQLVSSQANPSSSSKSRAKMHGKEQRNMNQNIHQSCSLSIIKKQNYPNQVESQIQTNSLVKSHHIPSHTENFQQENFQQFQSPPDFVFNKIHPNNQLTCEKKVNEQSLIICGSQQQKTEQQHYQYISPPQKRQYDNKSMSLLGTNKLANKSISNTTNLFHKDEAIRNSQAQQSISKKRDSSKKTSDVIQTIGNTVIENNILMKQPSKEKVSQKSEPSSKIQNPILGSNQNNKLRALNIEVQRRISLKHQKIKENNLFIGTHKNVSIDSDSISQSAQGGQIQTRFDQFNISKKQNSIKINQKRFPHLNNSVGDPSSIDKKQDVSNGVSILDSNREMQYSNNPHHNQIVQQLLALNSVNPSIPDQGFKKSSQNFTHANKSGNQNIIESATKLAANIYSQTSHKNNKFNHNYITNQGPNQIVNSYNYSHSFVQASSNNHANNLNQYQTSQQNSRLNSHEKVFSRLNKNKSLDENIKKKNSQSNILNQSNTQQLESSGSNYKQQQLSYLSNSLPNKKLKQHYYPLSNTSSQYQGHAQAASHPIFMSPQFKNHNNTFQYSDQFQLDNSNAFNKTATQNTVHTISQSNLKQNSHLLESDSTQINQMTLQNKNRTKQSIIPFNSHISQSLQQSLQSSQQYKQTASNSQNQFDEVLMIDNPISSPRFKKIKSIDKIFNQQKQQHDQQQQIQNINENQSPSKSSTPSQSNTSNQQYIATFSNLNEKDKNNSASKNSSNQQNQKKQNFHYNNLSNLNLKKNNFMKQQEVMRNSQQQQMSMGDGISQNSSYGFLTSRSMKKSLKDGQQSQKMIVQESPYNMDNIKKETSKSVQLQQQQFQQLQLSQNNIKSNNNFIKVKQNQKQVINQFENNEDGISSSRQEQINNRNEPNKFFTQNLQGNQEYLNQDQEYGQMLIQQQLQQQQLNQNSNQVIINLQIQQYPSAYINQPQFQNTQVNLRNQQQFNILNSHPDLNQQNAQSNQFQQQTNENYSKIKSDLKQNALDIIKTQKRKK